MANGKREQKKPSEPKLYISTIDNFVPQRKNANRHTERGLGMLSQAMSEDGYVAPMTATADGEVIDGSARLETAAEKFDGRVLVVEHSGDMPIVMKRTDIESADTEIAKRISVRQNRIAQADLEWDTEILKQLDSEELLKGLWSEDELGRLLTSFNVNEADVPQLASGDKPPFQQMTFTLHDEQAEEVKAALDRAKSEGGGDSAVNENSNGNALAWICQRFNRE